MSASTSHAAGLLRFSSSFCQHLTMDQISEITQHLLRSSPDALVVVDADGMIRFANETVAELFGHVPDQLIGQPLDILIPARLRPRHGHHLSSYIRNPGNREMGARIADLFAARADGSEFPAGIRLAPFNVGGEVFVAAAIRDMTERRLINEELILARTEAERANRAKSRFLATASHDLRQPMQTIRLLNAALLRTAPDRTSQELLTQQGQAIEGMARLLNALLDISRLESGAIEPSIGDVALNTVFLELRSEFESIARSRGIDLQVEPCGFAISTDRTLFSQLLQNLLGNALKYTDQGTVRLSSYLDGGSLILLVEDSGIGIPADKLERIFDEYYQVDTHGAKRMGVGLGLAIVKEVARLLGLTIRITSVVGDGTQVRLYIPERLLVAQPTHAVNSPATAAGCVDGTTRLFLVEDNDGVRLATEMFLKLEGYEISSAGSVSEAQKFLERLQPGNIVIADYHLDAHNTGLELLLDLRRRLHFELPGIILSGDLPTVLRSLKVPVENCKFLSKPVDTAELLGAIAELSVASRSEDQDRGAA